MKRAWWLPLFFCASLPGCEEAPKEPEKPSERSPNAQIQPAPLATSNESKPELGAAGARAASGEREALEAREPEAIRDDKPVKALSGEPADAESLELKAHFVWYDLPPSGAVRDLQRPLLDRIAKRAALNMAVSLTRLGQMRIRFDSVGFMVPDQSELLARQDLWGHVLAWPKGRAYRTLPLGSLRAVFLERRVDVAPLITPAVRKTGKSRALDTPTELVELGTSHGRITLGLATFAGFEASAGLLCRFLTELIAAEPKNVVCEGGKLPLTASYQWEQGRQLGFVVENLQRRSDSDKQPLQIPPPEAHFQAGEWPPQAPLLADAETLAHLRGTPGTNDREASADSALTIFNNTDLLRYVLLDATPIAWVLPGASLRIQVPQGRYQIALRDFLGQDPLPPRLVTAPGRLAAVAESLAAGEGENRR